MNAAMLLLIIMCADTFIELSEEVLKVNFMTITGKFCLPFVSSKLLAVVSPTFFTDFYYMNYSAQQLCLEFQDFL